MIKDLEFEEPELEEIIGYSPISQRTVVACPKRNAFIFVAGGFLSIRICPDRETAVADCFRRNWKLSDNIKQISCICCSEKGEYIAIGEKKPGHASVFVLQMEKNLLSEILEVKELKTAEHEFSAMAISSNGSRLITVGGDESPWFLLWDLKNPTPTIIGRYKLKSIPNQVCFGPSFSLVGGNKLLILIDTSIETTEQVELKAVNATIERLKDANFVSVGYQGGTSAYALTNNGNLCIIDTNSVKFRTKRGSKNVSIQLLNIKKNDTTCMSVHEKLVICGTRNDQIQAIKRLTTGHQLYGNFGLSAQHAVSIGITTNSTVAGYLSGSIVVCPRKLNEKPNVIIESHYGPICDIVTLCSDSPAVISCGADGTVRRWDIGNSEMSMYQANLYKLASPVHTAVLSGLMCTRVCGDVVFVGSDDGHLYVLNDRLELQTTVNVARNVAILAMDLHPTQRKLVVGSGDGYIHVYDIEGYSLNQVVAKKLHVQSIISVAVTNNCIVSVSSDSIKFSTCEACDLMASMVTPDGMLSLVYVPRPNLVLAGGFDKCLTLYCPVSGRVYRKYKLSETAYVLRVASHSSDLFFAAAMSDSMVLLVDAMSGNIVSSVQCNTSVITGLAFYENELIVSTLDGTILVMNLPQGLRDILGMTVPVYATTRMSMSGLALLKGGDRMPQWASFTVTGNEDKIDPEHVLDGHEEEEQPEPEITPKPIQVPVQIRDPFEEEDAPEPNDIASQVFRTSYIFRHTAEDSSILSNIKLLPKERPKEQPIAKVEEPVEEPIQKVEKPKKELIEEAEKPKEETAAELIEKFRTMVNQSHEFLKIDTTDDPDAREAQRELQELLDHIGTSRLKSEDRISSIKASAAELQERMTQADEEMRKLRELMLQMSEVLN